MNERCERLLAVLEAVTARLVGTWQFDAHPALIERCFTGATIIKREESDT